MTSASMATELPLQQDHQCLRLARGSRAVHPSVSASLQVDRQKHPQLFSDITVHKAYRLGDYCVSSGCCAKEHCSHGENSRLSNFMPTAKKEVYQNNVIDSVKQHLMMKHEARDVSAINRHYEEMKEVLLKSLEGKH